MRPWLQFTLAAAAVAAVAHLATILAAPNLLMGAAMKNLSRNGERLNAWGHAPRTTETSRRVVRPSPDLAYSACVYDLGKGPVRVTAAAWDDYMSVSVFAANSDNIFAINDRQAPRGIQLILVRKGEARPSVPGAIIVESPSTRGIVLQRRLAPTAERFAKAEAARAHDVCARLDPKN